MSCLKYIPLLGAMVLYAAPVHASAWMECKGKGEVVSAAAQEDGTYALKVRVKESVVTDGMASIGSDCVAGVFPVIVDVAAQEEKKAGSEVALKFRSYSGMGSEGPVSSNIWSLDEEAEAPAEELNR